ncbi:hypothetical protein [Aeropyrum camini]|uniref:Uncharacterized protein n=1 Tax=Aeropyrum camini SY1 = JCM 12091 TaxID=1198449 RepID=U3TC95_9CREN|nr:hypothetical protein [Aeropyrum camini]BAN90056.1 hypothetical protein ACAM_0587 [Aeropyrum camini SY1 = JCM 12091]
MYAEALCLGRLRIAYFKGPLAVVLVGSLTLPLPSLLCRPRRRVVRRGYSLRFHRILELALRARESWRAVVREYRGR